MKKILIIAKWFLLIWGGLSFLGLLIFGGIIAYQFGPGNKDRVGFASKKDIQFILIRGGLGAQKVEKIVKSYASSRSFTGDHLDAFAFKINNVSVAELINEKKDKYDIHWHRGDQLPEIIDNALSFLSASFSTKEIQWFPTESELRSDGFFCCVDTIYYSRERPIGASLIFVRPSDKMVFYISQKT